MRTPHATVPDKVSCLIRDWCELEGVHSEQNGETYDSGVSDAGIEIPKGTKAEQIRSVLNRR